MACGLEKHIFARMKLPRTGFEYRGPGAALAWGCDGKEEVQGSGACSEDVSQHLSCLVHRRSVRAGPYRAA